MIILREIYPNAGEKSSDIGISGLLNDTEFNIVPKGLKRLDRRAAYETNPNHASLKNNREKRVQLKEKKFQAQQKKNSQATKGDE